MKILKRAFCILFLYMFTSGAIAAETAGIIENLYINNSGTVLFKVSNPTSGSPICDNMSDIWQFKIEPSNQFFKEFYSTLLAAHMNGSPIIIGHGSSCGTGIMAVQVTYLYFRKGT